jgi:hypothetical protein
MAKANPTASFRKSMMAPAQLSTRSNLQGCRPNRIIAPETPPSIDHRKILRAGGGMWMNFNQVLGNAVDGNTARKCVRSILERWHICLKFGSHHRKVYASWLQEKMVLCSLRDYFVAMTSMCECTDRL